jgi:bifunctional non-homologous end joining protein LigD
MEKITLYYRQGSSDKVYQAAIEPRDGGYVVVFAYGRRGTTLQTGVKTQAPVDYVEAKCIYDKLVREKTAKGYTPGEDGTPYQHTDLQRDATGIHCQLLNPIEESALERFIRDPAWWMQEKHDGRRLLIQKHDGVVTGINKLGLTVAVPETIAQAARVFAQDFIIDGEAVGDVFHAFDLLSIDGELVTARGYCDRNLHLINLLASAQQRHIRLVETAFMPRQKQALFDQLKAGNREGVVFKQLNAPYTPGRPATGGTQYKYKFQETASCIVGKVNGKRSVSLKLFDGTDLVSVGNVTIPPNKEIPAPDDVVEIRYLYAYRGGSLFQPVYLGRRDDVTPQECGVDQLKYKAEAVAA